MTENIPQTSASDRIEAARKALAEYEHDNEGAPWLYNPEQDDSAALALALRALITPPSVGESVEKIAAEIVRKYHGVGVLRLVNHAVNAGIQYAHELWEPADRPSQEQMLRWLGLAHENGPTILGVRTRYVYGQSIDREEI